MAQESGGFFFHQIWKNGTKKLSPNQVNLKFWNLTDACARQFAANHISFLNSTLLSKKRFPNLVSQKLSTCPAECDASRNKKKENGDKSWHHPTMYCGEKELLFFPFLFCLPERRMNRVVFKATVLLLLTVPTVLSPAFSGGCHPATLCSR